MVRGKVQGVGFRDYVKMRARFLNLTGYVRNLSDHRTVEVVAEGHRDDLELLVEHIWEGPRMSRVDAVDSDWGEPTGRYDRFSVTH